jgi:HEAT repeat protein
MVDKMEKKKEGIVISSAGADEVFARRLEAGLSDLYNVWYYKNAIVHETNDWDSQIDKALSVAKIVIGVISPSAVDAENVRKEWLWVVQNGRKRGIVFILVEHEPADPGHQFAGYTWTSFANKPFDDALRELRTRMRRALQRRITSAVDAVSANDPYARDLKTLWNRVKAMLQHLIIPSLEAEPMELEALSVKDAVESNEKSREFVDLVLQRVGVGEDFRNIYEAFEFFGRRLLLLGAPGSGKTVTWLLQIREAILARLDDPSAPMPVIANIQSWDGTPLMDWLAKYPYTPKHTKKLIEDGKAIVFIDGLDELSDIHVTSGADDQYTLHRAFMQQLPENCAMLVTCRTHDYERMQARVPLNGAVCLTPLEEDQIEAFLKHLPDLYNTVKEDAELMQMVSTPLYLSMFAFTCEKLRPEKRAKLLSNVGNRAMFRELLVLEYIRQLYDHERRRNKDKTLQVSVERLMDGLGKVAMRNASNPLAVTNSFTQNELKMMSIKDADERSELTKVALDLGILQPQPNKRYKFIHMMVRDTLALYYCTRNYKEVSEYTDRFTSPALALGRLKDERATRFLRIILQDVSHEKVRRHVVKAFSYHRDPDTVKDLLKLLRDNDEYIQAYAIEALSAIHSVTPIDSQAVDPVLAVMKISTSKEVREAACKALGAFGSEKAIDPLIELLKDYNVLVVQEAARALSRLDAQRAIPALRDLLKQPDKGARSTVIEVLGKLHDKGIVPQLLDIVRNEKKPTLLRVAIDAVARIASPEAVSDLTRRLNQRDMSPRDEISGDIRSGIASALGAIGDPQAIPALREALRNEKVEGTYNHIMDALLKLGCDDVPMYELPTFDQETDPGDTDRSDPFDIPKRFWEDEKVIPDDDPAGASIASIPIL